MALLLALGARLFDDDGNLISGGKVRVYDANTTDYADLFSDEGLSVPLPNPVEANAAGWPSSDGSAETLVRAASGAYDVAFLDADDNVLATFPDVPTFGEDAELTRTVPGGGRFLFTGSAGAVFQEIGDPDPDNTGGTFTIRGWGGTQLDSLTLDTALLNITGRIKEGGKKLPGIVYTEATTFSAVTNVDIALPNDPTGVTQFDVDLWDFALSGSDDPIIQFSFDGGATFKTTALDYVWTRQFFGTGAATTVGSGTSGASSGYIQLMTGGTNVANKPASFRIRIYTPNSGSNFTKASWQGEFTDTVGLNKVSGAGNAMTGNGRATHMRLDTSGSNTITGKYRVVPIRGTGET